MGTNDTRKADDYQTLSKEDPVSGAVLLDQVLKRFNIDLKDPVNQIMVKWREIAGETIAQHSVCERYADGVLYLVCDHPSRASYIRMNSSELIKRIRGIFPEVDLKKIVTRVRPRHTT